MAEYVTNQLFFPSNAKTILIHLKSKAPSNQSPPLFSLNSIKAVPPQLQLTLNQPVRELALLNMEMPPFKEEVKQRALESVFSGKINKKSEVELSQVIEELKPTVNDSDREIFNQAISNYDRFKYFSHFDWCMTHWGTPEDVHALVTSTFEQPTSYIEFETLYTPPVVALQLLADSFPSVRFRLKYRYADQSDWTKTEIFPITPFGY